MCYSEVEKLCVKKCLRRWSYTFIVIFSPTFLEFLLLGMSDKNHGQKMYLTHIYFIVYYYLSTYIYGHNL